MMNPPESLSTGAPAGRFRNNRRTFTQAQKEIASLQSALAQVSAERDTALSSLQQERNAFYTYRKRMENEKEISKEVGQAKLLLSILPTLDDLERAIFHAEVSNSPNPSSLMEGLRLTYENLMRTLSNLGLETIPAAGEMYDPNLHEAVDKLETAEYPEGQILEEIQKGYRFKGVLLRPARVRVATAPSRTPAV